MAPQRTHRRTLTVKQRAFVAALPRWGWNLSKAAEAAGYLLGHKQGARLMRYPAVAVAVARALQRISDKAELDAVEAIRLNAQIARGNLVKMYGADGRLLHPTAWPPELQAIVKRIRVRLEKGRGGGDEVLEIELEGRSAALDRDYRRLKLMDPEGALQPAVVVERLLAVLAAGRARNAARRLPSVRDGEGEAKAEEAP